MDKPKIIKDSAERSRIWDEQKEIIFPEGINAIDSVPFTSFVILMEQMETSINEIDQNGLFYSSIDKFGKELLKSNPAHKVMADTQRMLLAYYARFGLSEWDRKSNEKKFGALGSSDDGEFDDLH